MKFTGKSTIPSSRRRCKDMKKPTTKQFNTLKKVLTYIRRYWFLLVLSR